MWPNPQFPSDLATFTEEILMENFIFCAVRSKSKAANRKVKRKTNRRQIFPTVCNATSKKNISLKEGLFDKMVFNLFRKGQLEDFLARYCIRKNDSTPVSSYSNCEERYEERCQTLFGLLV